MKTRITGIIAIIVIAAFVSSCATVVQTWDTYPIGTEQEVGNPKVVYVAEVVDSRRPNITVPTEKPVPGDVYKINIQDQTMYVEDPELQKVPAFLASALKQDLRDSGFEITTDKNQADFILETNLLRMDASKKQNGTSVLIASLLFIPTFGYSLYFIEDDVVADCTFETKIIDARSNREVSTKEYSKSETQKQRVYVEGRIVNPGYYLIKCLKDNVQHLVADLIAVSG